MIHTAGIDFATLAALVQTIVLAVTMEILILQLRSQERAVKESAYQKILDDYNDVVRMLVEHPELDAIRYDLVRTSPVSRPRQPLSAQERLVRSRFLMVYGLLERVYLLYARGWIDEGTWREWETWLAIMARHPLFGQVHDGSKGMLNRSFQDHVARSLSDSTAMGNADEPSVP